MIEKSENDRQLGGKYDGIGQELTWTSMWITLWELGISQVILGGFEKNWE